MEQTPLDTSASSGQNTKAIESTRKTYRKRLTEVTRAFEGDSLNYEEQLRIVHMIAAYVKDEDIAMIISQETGKPVTKRMVEKMRLDKSWFNMVDRAREEFEAKIADEELASRRRRVQELQSTYYKIKDNPDHLKVSLEVLSKIRDEVDGKASREININQYNQYNGLSDEELRKIIDENTRFLEIAEKKKLELTLGAEDVTPAEG